jgi:hypothetical protein
MQQFAERRWTVSAPACVCGFENSAEAKFCGGCARPLGEPQLKCPVCGHVNLPGARFCERDATPLDTKLGIVDSLATQTPTLQLSEPPREEKKAEKKAPRKQGIIGTVVSVASGSLRLVPADATDKPIVIKYPLRLTNRIAALAVPGDDLEVFGGRDVDGTISARKMLNLKTGVLLYRRSSWAIPFFTILILGAISVLIGQGAFGNLGGPEMLILIVVVLMIIVVSNIIRSRRDRVPNV